MKKFIIVLILATFISGCGVFRDGVDPIEVQTRAVEREPLDLETPAPLEPRIIQWHLITPENAEEKFEELSGPRVFFSLTADDYENLANNTANSRNHILSLHQIIEKYKEYYESENGE